MLSRLYRDQRGPIPHLQIPVSPLISESPESQYVKNLQALSHQKERDAELIHHIEAAIAEGPAIQKDIFERCKISGGIGEHRVRAALELYAEKGQLQRWEATKLPTNNTWQYRQLPQEPLPLNL